MNSLNRDMKKEVEKIIWTHIHQGEYDEDLPIYGVEEASKAVAEHFRTPLEEAKAEERKRCLEKAEFAIIDNLANNDYMGGFDCCKVAREITRDMENRLDQAISAISKLPTPTSKEK